MRGIDLSRYSFDFDLTFSLLTMHADGHVYHRYGGRDQRGADVWLSEASLERVLEISLADHDARGDAGKAPVTEALRIEEIPSFQKRDKGNCIHCHSVNTSLYEQGLSTGLKVDWIWKHPSPSRLGFDLNKDDQQLVTTVEGGSSAAYAGLKRGDRLLSMGGRSMASASDVMFALEQKSAAAGQVELSVERGGTILPLQIKLASGWKRGTSEGFAWRPLKWAMTPAPGFGGPRLNSKVLQELGLPADSFAFRIQYMVTWGDNKRYGQAAAKAGLRKGDVVISVGGKSDFDSIEHFHAWWRLKVNFGQELKIEYLREGKRGSLVLTAIP
jgi:serine protease Do